ncbi:gp53-like domain-containing protein [Phascolarctobacterium faecium]|uniref:gp53-like domain-containing protein n=1 Tax=Phascolarctobacterium faecium TaxID=33025 RepID=UPI003C6E3FEE
MESSKQWGYCSSRTATFPIPFPTAALFIVAVPKTTSTSATATGAEYLGTTSVNLYLHGTSGWYFVGGH